MADFDVAVKGARHGVGKQMFSVWNFRSIDNDQRIVKYQQTPPLGSASPRDALTTADPCQAGPSEGHEQWVRQLDRVRKHLLREGITVANPENLDVQRLELAVVSLPGRQILRSDRQEITP